MRHPRGSDVELAGHALWRQSTFTIEDVKPSVLDGPTDRDESLGAVVLGRVVVRDVVELGAPIVVQESRMWELLPEPRDDFCGQWFTCSGACAQRWQSPPRLLEVREHRLQ